jgi:MSHA pilin protein MshC
LLERETNVSRFSCGPSMARPPLTNRCSCIESRCSRAGFTLIELVVVVIVVGIVAVVAIPRLNTKTFDTVGFYQEALSSVRYAQKEAVAKRRVVCVSLTANSITVRFAKAIGSFTCDTDLTSPRGITPFTVTARAGVTLASAPAIATLYFDALGRPFDALNSGSPQRTLTISGDGTQSLVIEPETGYVH